MLKCVIEQKTFTLTFNQLADAFSQNTERQSNGQKEQKCVSAATGPSLCNTAHIFYKQIE